MLVTSRVTYVADNYGAVFERLFERCAPHLAGLLVIDNLSAALVRKTLGLYLAGCRGIASTLLRNMLGLPWCRRERWFEQRRLPVRRVRSLNDAPTVRWLREQQVDLLVNLRTRCIFQQAVLSAPALGCLNVHHGLLPHQRGAMCDLWALAEGEAAGFSIHRMSATLDGGGILLRQPTSEPGEKNYARHLARTTPIEAERLADLLGRIAATGAWPPEQPNADAQAIYRQTPDHRQIRALRQAGMVL